MLAVVLLAAVVLLVGSSGRGESETEPSPGERFTRDVEKRVDAGRADDAPPITPESVTEVVLAGAGSGAAAFAAIGGATAGPVGAAVGAFVGWTLLLGAQIWRDRIGDEYRAAVRDALRERGLRGTQTEVDEGILYLVLRNYPHDLSYDPRTGQPGLVWQTRRTPESGSLDVTPGPGVGREKGELDWHPAAFLSMAYVAGARRFGRRAGLQIDLNLGYDAHPQGTVLMGRVIRGQGSPGEKYVGGSLLWTKNDRLEFTPDRRTLPRAGDPIRLGAPWRVLRPGDETGIETVMSWWRAQRG